MAELAAQPTSIQSVYNWFRDDRLFVNRRYQRKLVWTLEEKQKLIDSILKKYPVPAILLAEKEDNPGTYEIIDGLQRLHAMLSFIEMAFPTGDGRYFNLEFFPTAKGYADAGAFEVPKDIGLIAQKEVTTILDYSLALSVMRNATESEINDVFDRINTYGHRLSDQERRQAGVQNEYSGLVRQIACKLRGDVSSDILSLKEMPSISIDLPKTKHGYEVRADEVFWVNQGVLRSTDLRDSMDEQCIADIVACIVGGTLIERSKTKLDEIYTEGEPEADRILTALEVYGADKVSDEFLFCVQEVLKVCAEGEDKKLRDIIFKQRTTNAFPSTFAIILIAFYELIVKEGKEVSDYSAVKKALTDASERIEVGQKATSPEERRKNIDIIKALVGGAFVPSKDNAKKIYSNHTTIDIEAVIRRSEIELGSYELKQGLLELVPGGGVDAGMIEKVAKTIGAIANNGPNAEGKILIGVTDRPAHAARVLEVDGVQAHKIGKRFVVGVNREAVRLGISVEQYFSLWKDGIKKSGLSDAVRDAVLSNMDFNSFFGLGVIVITVPPQTELSYVGDEVYWRNGDATELADSAKTIAGIVKRF